MSPVTESAGAPKAFCHLLASYQGQPGEQLGPDLCQEPDQGVLT